MRLATWTYATASVASLLGIAGQAIADPGDAVLGRAASALIFPLVDTRPNMGTLISITNTNTSTIPCWDDFREGDICLHYTYFGFDTDLGFCREFDIDECLTPGDTLTVLADQHNPEMEIGWLWVEARDPVSFEPIDFDYLIGSAMVVDMGSDFLARYMPYGFRARPDLHSDSGSRCFRGSTDVDYDGAADFNGVEYDFWPEGLFLDNFFEEGGSSPEFSGLLALASCDVDFQDADTTTVSFFIFNNEERRFSRDLHFECFFLDTLSSISNIFNDLRGDPNELAIPGRPLPTGWLKLSGTDAILGVFIERIVGSSFAGGDALEMFGQFGGPNDPVWWHRPCSIPRFG